MDILSNKDRELLNLFRKGAVDILPDEEKMTLWRRIERKTVKRVFVAGYAKWAAAASIALLVSIGGYLWYNSGGGDSSRRPTLDALQMAVVETSNQQKQKVMLPDSTVVWLNANSRLEYCENFNENRIVRVEGEAYFEVAHRAEKIFTVYALEMELTVLGTVFNVTAYKNDAEITTTLVEGKIALQFNNNRRQRAILTENQQIVFNKDLRELNLEHVDTELYTSWRNGYYRFENATLEKMAKNFERMFGIEISFEDDSLKNILFTGTVLSEQNIETILELLQIIMDFQYVKVSDNKVIIK